MKTTKTILAVAVAVIAGICFYGTVSAGSFSKDKAGTTGAQFLKIGCGARAIGMGEAYSAAANDATAIYWNPAGLAGTKQAEIAAMHAVWFEQINYDFLAYALPALGGGLGVSINYLSMESLEKLDINGDKAGNFKPYDAAVTVGYAHKLVGAVKGGASLKVIRQEIDGDSATGLAGDFGLSLPVINYNTELAVVLQNVGGGLKFVDESYALPLAVRVGMSYKGIKDTVLAADAVAPVDNDPNIHMGCEYTLRAIQAFPIALRAGYKTTTIQDLDSLSGLSAGIGFQAGLMSLDYAWVPYGDLGETHRISFGIKFGQSNDKKVVQTQKKGVKYISKPVNGAKSSAVSSKVSANKTVKKSIATKLNTSRK